MASPRSEHTDLRPPTSQDRLDSWKEIAAYLGRSVPTVQRWEKKEGLPVRRHAHERQGSVYGYKSELDLWWQKRGAHVISDEPAEDIKSSDAKPPTPIELSVRNLFPKLLIACVLVGIVAGTLYFARARRHPASRPQITSLVVLPLLNLSHDPEQEYFADGLTEVLINDLARIRALRVISRTSAMQYKGARKTLPVIARELQVDGVVEGSVQRSGGRVRIIVQLIHPASDTHLWSESYERDLRDVLSLQGEVARDIANEISVEVTRAEKEQLSATRSRNAEAQDLYLRSTHLLGDATQPADLRKATALLQTAVQKDPQFATGYAGLSVAYFLSANVHLLPPAEALEQAGDAARKALELDPNLAEAHAALGDVRMGRYDWQGALLEFDRALEQNPNSVEAHNGLAVSLALLGRHEEALLHARRLRDLDPARGGILGVIAFNARRYDLAEETARQVVNYGIPSAHLTLARLYLHSQRYPEAMEEFAQLPAFSTVPHAEQQMREAFAQHGGRGLARWMAEFWHKQTHRPPIPQVTAWFYAEAGERRLAIDTLERAYAQGAARLYWLPDPGFDTIRSDPRFQDLLRKMNLPESLGHVPDR